MCLTTKVDVARWTEFFQEKVEAMLKEKVLLALSTSKINDGTNFKDNVGSTPTANCTRKKK